MQDASASIGSLSATSSTIAMCLIKVLRSYSATHLSSACCSFKRAARQKSPGSKPWSDLLSLKAVNLLEPKRDHLSAQFARIGLFSRQLNTRNYSVVLHQVQSRSCRGRHIAESSSYSAPLVRLIEAIISSTYQPNPCRHTRTCGATGATPTTEHAVRTTSRFATTTLTPVPSWLPHRT